MPLPFHNSQPDCSVLGSSASLSSDAGRRRLASHRLRATRVVHSASSAVSIAASASSRRRSFGVLVLLRPRRRQNRRCRRKGPSLWTKLVGNCKGHRGWGSNWNCPTTHQYYDDQYEDVRLYNRQTTQKDEGMNARLPKRNLHPSFPKDSLELTLERGIPLRVRHSTVVVVPDGL